MSCVGREAATSIEKRRREMSEMVHRNLKGTRATVLFAVRDMVKEGASADPDMNEKQKQASNKLIDKIWKDVIMVVEFKSNASLYSAHAASEYQESVNFGHPPALCTVQRLRAWFLYTLAPFDKSIHGKVKNPAFLVLTAISMFPFLGVRLYFFMFLFLMHVTHCPADTYQLMSFILIFKGTQFKSGGILLFCYGIVQYFLCIKPGDIESCSRNGPGMNIWTWLSLLDLFGSMLFGWIAWLWIPMAHTHESPLDRARLQENTIFQGDLESIDDMLVYDESNPGQQPSEHSEKKHMLWMRLAGSRRIFALLAFDFLCFSISCLFGCWIMFLDLKAQQTEDMAAAESAGGVAGVGGGNLPWVVTWAAVKAYAGTPQGRGTAFKARVMYHLFLFPFAILMAPGLSMIVALVRPTGYNKNGYCFPFTLRPVASKSWRSCSAGGGGPPPGAAASSGPVSSSTSKSRGCMGGGGAQRREREVALTG